MLYLYASDNSASGWWDLGLVAVLILALAVLVIVFWMRPGGAIPSAGEAQAIGDAPLVWRPYGRSLGQIAAGFVDDEPDETDGPTDDDRVVDGEDDGYPHGRLALAAAPAVSGAELAEQVRRDSEIKDEPVLFHEVVSATGCYPMLDDAVLHSGMTGAFSRLTPEVLAALDAQRLVAEAVSS